MDISESDAGIRVEQFSDYPFSFRPQKALDSFQARALRELREDPVRPVFAIEEQGDGEFARFAVARVMTKTYCACHNAHPSSTKMDWEPGDVRGALEVVQRVEMSPGDGEASIRQHLWFVAVLLIGAWSLTSVLAMRQRVPAT